MMRMIAILSFIGIIFVMIVAIGNTGQCLPSRPGEKLSDIDEKKFCVYKNNTVVSSTTHSVMSTTTMSTTFKSSMVPSPRPNNEVKMIFGFYDDISSLSNEDVSQWAWSNMKRGVDHFCVKKTSIKLTVPEKDVNQLSRDLVSLQYQLRNSKLYLKNYKVCWMHIVAMYNCEEEESKTCLAPESGLQNWHIVCFSISGVFSIVDAILLIYLCQPHIS